jgi:hypothetical protein
MEQSLSIAIKTIQNLTNKKVFIVDQILNIQYVSLKYTKIDIEYKKIILTDSSFSILDANEPVIDNPNIYILLLIGKIITTKPFHNDTNLYQFAPITERPLMQSCVMQSFALYPSNYQPSGFANLSRNYDISVGITTQKNNQSVSLYEHEEDFIFIGFPNTTKVYPINKSICNKNENSVLIGFFELENEIGYSFILDDFSPETFLPVYLFLMEEISIFEIETKEIRILMDKYGLCGNYILDKNLTFKNILYDLFIHQ